MTPGFYWIREKNRPGDWTVARFDGSAESGWTFIGSLYLCDTDELFGPDGDYELGPEVGAPPS